eukprot:CAMPEP_0197679732 /NCGR_PEP_ID=MMETSP1338-20131121/92139_1 /TAXON_ID=43686 ORGANISM="Pelagodinium beii, Strain RCC1491" /NCGR_SAMPLE_ID=MMETSP1338 /ASSEMBLY_ACC=CAM_ASM_000754 /LENGTH=99 /DNA_ID=CAMNT_0043260815 /DNA_START=77 /DNA_END=376 /DNA_ORIENTATION=+
MGARAGRLVAQQAKHSRNSAQVPGAAAMPDAASASQAQSQGTGVQRLGQRQVPPLFSGHNVDKSLRPLCMHCHTLNMKEDLPLEAPFPPSSDLVQQDLE